MVVLLYTSLVYVGACESACGIKWVRACVRACVSHHVDVSTHTSTLTFLPKKIRNSANPALASCAVCCSPSVCERVCISYHFFPGACHAVVGNRKIVQFQRRIATSVAARLSSRATASS